MDGPDAPGRGGRIAAGPAHARPPAGLHGLVDLRLRRADRGRPGLGDRDRLRAGRHGPELVARAPRAGLFVNSLHLWSVEAFFFFMVIHLWGKFFMAAWRGKRRLTWVTGVISFLVSVGAAFTGYLSQQNFDSQWISTQAKDGINSTGAGAVLNVLNFGQMLMWHIVLLPIGVVVIAGLHVLLVRRRGIVPPFDRATATETDGAERRAGPEHGVSLGTAAPPLQPRPRRRGVERRLRPLRHRQGGVRRPARGGRADRAVWPWCSPRPTSPPSRSRPGPWPTRWTSPRPPSPSWTAPAATATYGPPYNTTPDARSTWASSSPSSGSASTNPSTPRRTS